MYRSDSDESIRRYHLDQYSSQHLIPQSTLSLNQLSSYRRRSNPDIYPGARRFSTSYSDEDILSNDQLDQIHFDPRYRDYRSASSLNNSNYRLRSNSLHSMGSPGHINLTPQYQPYRRVSSVSPPLCSLTVPLAPQKRWNTNPSIFIEEYREEENQKSSIEVKDEKENSQESLCNASNNSPLLQGLCERDIKSFGDLSQIPFIDEDDSNDSAPCRFNDESSSKKIESMRPCRKTVSFDVIQNEHGTLYERNGKKFPPKFSQSNFYSTYKNPTSFHAPSFSSLHNSRAMMGNVRTTRDGYIPRSHSQPPPFPSQHRSHLHSLFKTSFDDDHCILVDKLIKIMEEETKNETRYHCHSHCTKDDDCDDDDDDEECKSNWSNNIKEVEEEENNSSKEICYSSGKVKALTSYFNSLPHMTEGCNCIKKTHQSTPNLSLSSRNRYNGSNKLSCEEMTKVQKQLKEYSEFGLEKKSRQKSHENNNDCVPMKKAISTPVLCYEKDIFSNCNEHHEMLNRLDKVRLKRLRDDMKLHSMDCRHRCNYSLTCNNFVDSLPNLPKPSTSPTKSIVHHSEKHKCRSACFKDPERRKKKNKLKLAMEDDNESLII